MLSPGGPEGATGDPLIGRRIGDYEIRRVVGRGGMGSVYEAFHVHLHRIVALKVLAPHLLDNPQAIERFRREMRAIGRLNSPHIVTALDASLGGDIQYLAMEYIDGIDADEMVRRLHAMPVEDACEIVRQAALGLEDAHQQMLVHRDIKPKNIAIASNGKVKILDLGLALCKSEVMATGRLTAQAAIGSYQYMAPEQFDDSHEVDIRADIYGLGCTLFHLLAGAPPFSGTKYRTLTSLMAAHRSTAPPQITEFNGNVPNVLAGVVGRTLAKEPDARFQTPIEVAQALEPFAGGADLAKLVHMSREAEVSDEAILATQPGAPTTDREPETRERWQAALLGTTDLRRQRRRRLQLWFAASAVAVLMSVAAYFALRNRITATGQAERERLAQGILVMPGLNGLWWMDETPWMLPPVRAAVAEGLAAGSSGSSITLKGTPVIPDEALDRIGELTTSIDTSALQSSLNDLFGRFAPYSPRDVEEAYFAFKRDDPESIDNAKLTEKLARISEPARQQGKDLSAVDWHLLAVAAHKAADWDQAKTAYEQALAAWDKRPPSLLGVLCQADYGEMLFAQGRFEEAAERFRIAAGRLQARDDHFPEFLVYAQCREADSLRKLSDVAGQASDLLEHAERDASRLPKDHPLNAFLAERRGWLALDDWRIAEAVEQFERAIALRQKSADLGNRRSQFFIFFDQQGLAMAERLRGKDETSRALLATLAEQLYLALTDGKRYSAKQRSELKSRLLNTLERSADTYLYGSGEPSGAVDVLSSALDFADREIDAEGPLERHIDRIRCKSLIARAWAGQDLIGELPSIADESTDTPLETKYRQLARAAITASKDPAAVSALRDLIFEQKQEDPTRDELELILLAGRLLYRFAPPGEPSLGPVVPRISQWLKTVGREGDESVLGYLRPHYDALIRAATSLPGFPPDELAEMLLQARNPSFGSRPSDFLVFYLLEDEGVVVDRVAGQSRVIPLPFGSRQILQARSDPALQTELAARIPEGIESRRRQLPAENVYWSDAVLGITDADYPNANPMPESLPSEPP